MKEKRFTRIETSGKNYGVLKRTIKTPRKHKIIAYDLETTPIKEGTPKVLYITAYGEDFELSKKVNDLHHLKDILCHHFLTWKNRNTYFVGWNANKFDVYFIAKALLMASDDYVMRPLMTKSHMMRGLAVHYKTHDYDPDKFKLAPFNFLDGMAMTGYMGKLKNFLNTFAPNYQKQDIGLDKGVVFDPDNFRHCRYAERDSEGLYHAMQNVDEKIHKATGLHLAPTIGNLGIKNFQRHMPEKVECYMPPPVARDAIYKHCMRGGFVFLQYKYRGKVWKYDLNQAYAAAMRDAKLPHNKCTYTKRYQPGHVGIYRINAIAPKGNIVPFYHKPESEEGNRIVALYSFETLDNTWITSIELQQLIDEGWQYEILDGWRWIGSFNMAEMVNNLEHLRTSDPDGPSGPLGTMAKSVGNNSYGKFAERLWGENLIFSRHCPPGFMQWRAEIPEYKYIWVKLTDKIDRPYHRPQLAAMITAHVRMQVRRAALLGGPDWIYADTDCVVFRRPILELEIHPTKYGAWKEETAGVPYIFCAKKVYCSEDGKTSHAKGMTVKNLTVKHYQKWYEGMAPQQTQLQTRNIKHVLAGGEMYVKRIKVGQKF